MTGRRERNREKLYQTAISLISEHGFDDVSMADIADEAGMARASVFNHFPSKQDFLIEYFVRTTHDILTATRETEADTFEAFIHKFADSVDGVVSQNRMLYQEITRRSVEGNPLRDTETHLDTDMVGLFCDALLKGQSRNEIHPSLDVDTTARLMLATLTGIAREWSMSDQSGSLGSTIKSYFLQIFSGLKN